MAQHDEMMNPSLWRPASRSPPSYPQNVPSPNNMNMPILPGSSRLEHFRNRQEAAISFEDDLEFNPSLTPDELNEARRQLVTNVMSHSSTPPSPPRGSRNSHSSSPMFSNRAIPIIDPTKMTPLPLPTPPPKTTRSPPQQYMRPTINNSTISNFSSIFSPNQPASVNPYSPPQAEWASAWDLKSQQQNRMNIPTRSIPIVDPNSGSILNTLDRRSYYPMPAQQQRMVGTWFDVTVR